MSGPPPFGRGPSSKAKVNNKGKKGKGKALVKASPSFRDSRFGDKVMLNPHEVK